MADHNDPNAVNSIFSDIDVSAADVYDMFGYPSDDRSDGERVVIALTFASVPTAGVFDTDMLYRLQITTAPRAVWPDHDRQPPHAPRVRRRGQGQVPRASCARPRCG